MVVACAGSRSGSSPDPSLLLTIGPTPEPSALVAASPDPTAAALPTVFVPQSDSLEAGLIYRCGVPFPIEIMEAPGDAEKSSDPATMVLTGVEYVPTGIDDWWLLSRTPNVADYLGRRQAGGETLYFYARSGGEGDVWQPRRFGTCTPGAETAEGTATLGWWIRSQDWPSPTARTLEIRTRDGCLETLRDRLLEPTIRADEDRILIIMAARHETEREIPCSEEQVVGLTIALDEPVGDRTLWDARELPFRDAHVPTEPLNFNECCG